MRTTSITKGQPIANFSRLCLYILISLILATGGLALNPSPVHAILTIAPSPLNANLTECVPYSVTFSPVGNTCPVGPYTYFYWFAGAPPPWVTLDINTGVLTACPPAGSAGVYNFGVGVTELWPGPVPPPCAWPSAASAVTLNVAAGPPMAPLTIDPTYTFTWTMEGMPYALPLSATGCSGNYLWSAVGLPLGLSVTDNVGGMISGIPAAGTAGIYTVDVTVTDTATCDNCCPPATRPFVLVIDSYALYLAAIVYTSTYDFDVQIGPGLTQGTTPVIIDGSREATLGGNQSASFTAHQGEGHLVSVDQTVSGPDSKTRFAVIGSNQMLVNESNTLAYFDYAQEVFIETGSDPAGVAQPPGSDFYAIGDFFTSTAPSPVTMGGQPDTKYVFKNWSLPDGSTNPNRDLVFTVNKAGTALARYDTYYLLSLVSNYPPIRESSWELKDSTATWDLALQAVPMPNIFGAIGGVMRPDNDKGSHLMTGPYTQEIQWRYDFTVPIILAIITLLIIGAAVFFLTRGRGSGNPGAATAAKVVPAPPAEATAETKPAATTVAKKKAETKTKPEERAEFCPKCGTPVAPDAEFCKKCGRKIT